MLWVKMINHIYVIPQSEEISSVALVLAMPELEKSRCIETNSLGTTFFFCLQALANYNQHARILFSWVLCFVFLPPYVSGRLIGNM